MERKGATYLVMEAMDKDYVETNLLYLQKYIEIPEIRLFIKHFIYKHIL